MSYNIHSTSSSSLYAFGLPGTRGILRRRDWKEPVCCCPFDPILAPQQQTSRGCWPSKEFTKSLGVSAEQQ